MTTIAIEQAPRLQRGFYPGIATAYTMDDSPIITSATLSRPEYDVVRIEASDKVRMSEAGWFQPTLDAISNLPWNTDDWALVSNHIRTEVVVRMLKVLAIILDEHAPPPSIVPTWEGGLQAEWHRNGVDLEIEVLLSGEVEYFFSGPNDEQEGRANDDIHKLTEYAQTLL